MGPFTPYMGLVTVCVGDWGLVFVHFMGPFIPYMGPCTHIRGFGLCPLHPECPVTRYIPPIQSVPWPDISQSSWPTRLEWRDTSVTVPWLWNQCPVTIWLVCVLSVYFFQKKQINTQHTRSPCRAPYRTPPACACAKRVSRDDDDVFYGFLRPSI